MYEDEGEYYDDEDYEDDYEDDGPRRRRERRRRRGPHPAIVALIVVVAVLAGGYYGVQKFYEKSLEPVTPGSPDEIVFYIEEGDSVSLIAERLKGQGLIKNEYVFRLHCKRMEYDRQFKFGEFVLSKSMSVDEIAETIIAGTAVAKTKTFTIPEGYNITQIAKALEKQNIISAADFMGEVENGEFPYDFLEGCPPGPERLEGFLYPETYEVYADATAHEVVDKMLGQFDLLFKPEYYERAAELEMNPREVVTLGSIVEREAVAAADRPIMAGVFLNRLAQGMKLESCATIQYILGEPKEDLLDADLAIESPYNTYLHEGLPPGPICSPRMASVEAALYPDENDYIFFVLSDALDGSHKFSKDYNEFLKNKDAYYKARKAAEG